MRIIELIIQILVYVGMVILLYMFMGWGEFQNWQPSIEEPSRTVKILVGTFMLMMFRALLTIYKLYVLWRYENERRK